MVKRLSPSNPILISFAREVRPLDALQWCWCTLAALLHCTSDFPARYLPAARFVTLLQSCFMWCHCPSVSCPSSKIFSLLTLPESLTVYQSSFSEGRGSFFWNHDGLFTVMLNSSSLSAVGLPCRVGECLAIAGGRTSGKVYQVKEYCKFLSVFTVYS